MNDGIRLLDPTAETSPVRRGRRAPPPALEGLTLGLLDIGKARGSTFLDRLESHFTGRGLDVKRYAKPTNTAPRRSSSRRPSPRRSTSSSTPSPTEARARRAVCMTCSTSMNEAFPA